MTDKSRLLPTDGFNQLAQTADGFTLYNRHDVYIGRSVALYGEYNGQEASLLEACCIPGARVIEAGANIGTHTVAMARRVGPGGAVHAFEPQRLVFQTLCANVALNSLTNVHCHWAAVGRTRGSIRVPSLDPGTANNFGGLALEENLQQGDQVPVITLDDYCALASLRLSKIDVEGMERQVLEGAQKLIARFKPLIYLENDRIDRSMALMTWLDQAGYELWWDLPPLYRPDNHYRNPDNVFGKIRSFNLLCVHPDNPLIKVNSPRITDFTLHPLASRDITAPG